METRYFDTEEDASEFRAWRPKLWDSRIECGPAGRWRLEPEPTPCLCGAPACPGCGACDDPLCVAQGHPCRCEGDDDGESCSECTRSFGPHYRGPCNH